MNQLNAFPDDPTFSVLLSSRQGSNRGRILKLTFDEGEVCLFKLQCLEGKRKQAGGDAKSPVLSGYWIVLG